jgi:tRNA modification GTPase
LARAQLRPPRAPLAVTDDTIAAIATAPGAGAIGIIRIAGPACRAIGEAMLGPMPPAREAALRRFVGDDGEVLDQGIALWFPAPASFTGDDLLELQGHGGPQLLDLLLARALGLGARAAKPGEFTERAFLNGKLDLAQAEAIADLIAASNETQARLASRSLQGVFSRRIRALVEDVTRLRVLLEAALDFPDEDLDALDIDTGRFDALIAATVGLLRGCRQGELVRDGLLVVIAGAPNAGKSSLLNHLAGTDAAIVTEIPGTTRDLLRATIQIDGLPIRLVDTAGLREALDPVEQEGVRRARAEIAQADQVVLVVDDTEVYDPGAALCGLSASGVPPAAPITLVRNKIDRSGRRPGVLWRDGETPEIACSALTGTGVDLLRDHLKSVAGYRGPDAGEFSARRRHVTALQGGLEQLRRAQEAWRSAAPAELVAEELRQAQRAFGEITGEVSSDDLLGRIFGEFCIGK